MLLGAIAWAVLCIPGVLVANCLFSSRHPFGRTVSRPGVASVIGLLLFGVVSWTGTMAKWYLNSVLIVYAVLYLTVCVSAGWWLLKRGPASDVDRIEPEPLESHPMPRWCAIVVLGGLAVMMLGIVLASPEHVNPESPEAFWFKVEPGKEWWRGSLLGAVGALAAAMALVVARFRKANHSSSNPANTAHAATTTDEADAAPRSRKGKRSRREPIKAVKQPTLDWGKSLPAFLWIAAAGLTWYLMLVTYRMPMEGLNRYGYDVDDVTYVSEAVDYRYDLIMGTYEPSIGSDRGLTRAAMTPLFSPLVATVSKATGLDCAGIQHSVYPPLMILLGSSCAAAALLVLFRSDRWLVPLGLLITLLLLCKSWTYARTIAEMVVYRAMATKSIHLLIIHPLQLATLVLFTSRVDRRNLSFAVMVAVAGHLVHPFASILGAAWAAIMCGATLILRRPAFGATVIVFVAYAALGGVCKWANSRPLVNPSTHSGRVAGTVIESNDMVRVDVPRGQIGVSHADDLDLSSITPQLVAEVAIHGVVLRPDMSVQVEEPGTEWLLAARQRSQTSYRLVLEGEHIRLSEVAAAPIVRHDLNYAMGLDLLFNAGALAILPVLALGLVRREWLYVGIIGLVVFILCNSTVLGRLLGVALPMGTMWRARWMLPSLLNLAAAAALFYWATAALLGRAGRVQSAASSLACAAATVAAFSIMLLFTRAMWVKPGEPPEMLSKFTPDIHELVDLLGGVEANPFVWGPEHVVTRELPQLMPNVRLVKSRDKMMLPVDHENFRNLVNAVEQLFTFGLMQVSNFQDILKLYPGIDTVVADYGRAARGTRQPAGQFQAKVMEELGWKRIGRAGRYEVWKRPDATQ